MKKSILFSLLTLFFFSCSGVVYVVDSRPEPVVTSHGEYEAVVGYVDGLELVERYYSVTVANQGNESAYGVTANLRIRAEEPDPHDFYSNLVFYRTEAVYLVDELAPGWEAEVSYTLYPNEDVTAFHGIEWVEWEAWASGHPSNEKGLAKKSKNDRIKVKKRRIQ